jgi:hypothetical protein
LRRQHIKAVAYFVEFFGFQQNFMGGHKLRGLLSAFKEAGPAFINVVSHLLSHHINSICARSLFLLDRCEKGDYNLLLKGEIGAR